LMISTRSSHGVCGLMPILVPTILSPKGILQLSEIVSLADRIWHDYVHFWCVIGVRDVVGCGCGERDSSWDVGFRLRRECRTVGFSFGCHIAIGKWPGRTGALMKSNMYSFNRTSSWDNSIEGLSTVTSLDWFVSLCSVGYSTSLNQYYPIFQWNCLKTTRHT
jgi:hypothetical protein